jgi:hypothetical protein
MRMEESDRSRSLSPDLTANLEWRVDRVAVAVAVAVVTRGGPGSTLSSFSNFISINAISFLSSVHLASHQRETARCGT